MSRRRRSKHPKTDSSSRAERRPAHRRYRHDREAAPERAPAWEIARIGLQGPGHPPLDAPFEERMAPYVDIVDAVLLHAAATLGSNVDVSFMKADFSRLIAERMLVSGMKSLLAAGGATRGSVLLETLVAMVESHGTEREERRRNGRHPRDPIGHSKGYRGFVSVAFDRSGL